MPGAAASGFFVILSTIIRLNFIFQKLKFGTLKPKMEKTLKAIENFKTLNCAQSVLLSFADDVRLEEKTALRIALGFGGGMGMGETCGAVTGAYMVLGMKAHSGGKSYQELKDETKAAVRRFNSLFTERHGALSCKRLLGVDISTPEGAEAAQENQLFDTLCPKFVASASEILEGNF